MLPLALVAAAFLYGAGSKVWYQYVTSPRDDPARTETCALPGIDAVAFRALVARIELEGERGGGRCVKQPDEATCFQDLMRSRLAHYAPQIGSGMEARMMALHALMRANRAVLLAQETLPPQRRFTVTGSTPDGRFTSQEDRPPLVPRAERFVYALDTREIGLSAPALFGRSSGGRHGFHFDEGRTRDPSGSYAIAEFTVTLSDPALKYPDDISTGAVEEDFHYVEAAWSHRRPDKASHPQDRPPLQSYDVRELASRCPARPAWLDTPAVSAHPSGTPTAAERRGQLFEFLKK
jgi:hypothetical protein